MITTPLLYRHYLKAGTTVQAYTFSSGTGTGKAVYDITFSIAQLSH